MQVFVSFSRTLLRTLAALLLLSGGAAAAELVVVVQAGCAWCERFEADVAGAYPHTEQGARAPLRRVDLANPWPEDLTGVKRERLTPTFILVENGQEIARLRGYPGDEHFWFLIDEMLAQLPPAAQSEVEAAPLVDEQAD